MPAGCRAGSFQGFDNAVAAGACQANDVTLDAGLRDQELKESFHVGRRLLIASSLVPLLSPWPWPSTATVLIPAAASWRATPSQEVRVRWPDGRGLHRGLAGGEIGGFAQGAVGGFQIPDLWSGQLRLRLLRASRARRCGRDEYSKDQRDSQVLHSCDSPRFECIDPQPVDITRISGGWRAG
jgi:hypothetical protein